MDSELTGHGVKVWLAQGAEMGSGAVFWTQSFWLQILGVKNAVEYRKQFSQWRCSTSHSNINQTKAHVDK